MTSIVPIVEGHGEVEALPVLLRKLLHGMSVFDVEIDKPINAHGVGGLRSRLERLLEYGTRRPNCSAIIVVRDSEDECPLELVCDYGRRTLKVGCAVPVAFAIAKRMYETWLVASIETIAGTRGIAEDASFEGEPETLSSPKAWLTSQMPPGRAYKETLDQAAMTDRLDPVVARRCRSFRRLEAALEFLLERIRTGQSGMDPSSDELGERVARDVHRE